LVFSYPIVNRPDIVIMQDGLNECAAPLVSYD
jgi:hypothetical protein